MTMDARFPGVCKACSGKIWVGDKIEWTKGEGARHTRCPEAGAQAAPKRARPESTTRPSRPRTYRAPSPLPEGHKIVTRRSEGRGDAPTDAGECVYLTKVPGGGGPDGHYWTIVGGGKSAPNEDNGQYDWSIWEHVRPATAEEAAPVAARREQRTTAANARKALLAELAELLAAGERTGDVPCPACAKIPAHVEDKGARYGVADDGAVVRWHGGHYDDYRSTLTTFRGTRAIEVLRALGVAL